MKKVTVEKIFTNIKKTSTITYEDLIKTLDAIVKGDILYESWRGRSTTYLIVEDADSLFVPDIIPNILLMT